MACPGLLTFHNFIFVTDAIDAIILHSESANWLLNRKKLTRAILFEYLNSKKIPISGQAEKSSIISRIQELWASLSVPQSEDVSDIQPISSQESCVEIHSMVPEMGLKFAQWFYEILLAFHKQTAAELKLSEQFWRDSCLKITLNSSGTITCQEALGSDEVGRFKNVILLISKKGHFYTGCKPTSSTSLSAQLSPESKFKLRWCTGKEGFTRDGCYWSVWNSSSVRKLQWNF